MSLAERWTHFLDELRTRGSYRTLALPGGVDFCSNDYLGYAAAGWKAVGRVDVPHPQSLLEQRSGTAARLLRGQHAIWDEVESALARWHGADAALMMSSGYAANEGLLSTVIHRDDWVASDQFNHASIIDGLRLSRAERFVYRHADLGHLEDGLRQAAAQRTAERQLFIVTESLFGMDGDVAPLGELVAMAERFGAHVVADEAHTTGCFGPTGSGLVDSLGLRRRVLATVHTGGKALAVPGAYICGSALLRELLINRCRHFMFSTALPPAVGLWWREAIARVQPDSAARTALHEAKAVFRRELAVQGISPGGTEYIVPVIIGDDAEAVRVAAQLQARGWDIRAIRTPTVPPGTARLRISIHSDHPPPLLAEVAAGVAEAARSAGH
jgi:8-amino-7-oxononanoate synthase